MGGPAVGRRVSPEARASVAGMVQAVVPSAVMLRRHLHMNPELSGAEHDTTATIVDRLSRLRPRVLPSGTGAVADIGTAPTVALRADIDALAMTDQKDVPYRSRRPGVAHACGHDVHTAVVVGAGEVLSALHGNGMLRGGVRLIFEPSEETVPGGAVEVVRDGWLTGIKAIFAVHCDPRTPVGQIGSRVGAITSASDRFQLVLNGPGGHTARPHETVDLIREVSRVAMDLPDILGARVGDRGEIRLVFGAVSSGNAANVIPAVARLEGTARTPHSAAWDCFPVEVPRAVAEVLDAPIDSVTGTDTVVGRGSRADGLTWEAILTRGVPPVVNYAAPTELMAAAARSFLGEHAVVKTPHSWGGDSYGWYLVDVPGTYARLGTKGDSLREVHDLHTPGFDVDEKAIAIGIELLVHTVLDWLDA